MCFNRRGDLILQVFAFTGWSFSIFDSAHVKLPLLFKGVYVAFLLLLRPNIKVISQMKKNTSRGNIVEYVCIA